MNKNKLQALRKRADSAFAELEREVSKLDSAKADSTRKRTPKKRPQKARSDSTTSVGTATLRRGKATETKGMSKAQAEKANEEMRLKKKYMSFSPEQRKKLMAKERALKAKKK